MQATLSDAFINHPVHLNQNHIDFSSAKEVPDSYTWPPILDDDSSQADNGFDVESSVPIIDLSDPISSLKGQIGSACESWGVFQITNHGVPMTLLEKAQTEGKRLFSLPLQQKLKAARSPDGISGYGVARISSFLPKLMWSEGFTIAGSAVDHARRLWPEDYINFCGALVVNIGDLLHILSNGRYPSVLHRAVVNQKCHRLSFAYLYGPPMHVQISPLSKLVSLNSPPLYRPVTWSEYLGTKARHFNKALSSVRL